MVDEREEDSFLRSEVTQEAINLESAAPSAGCRMHYSSERLKYYKSCRHFYVETDCLISGWESKLNFTNELKMYPNFKVGLKQCFLKDPVSGMPSRFEHQAQVFPSFYNLTRNKRYDILEVISNVAVKISMKCVERSKELLLTFNTNSSLDCTLEITSNKRIYCHQTFNERCSKIQILSYSASSLRYRFYNCPFKLCLKQFEQTKKYSILTEIYK